MIGAAGADPLGRSNAGIVYVLFSNHTLGGTGDIDLATLTPEQGFRIYGAVAGDMSGVSVGSVDINLNSAVKKSVILLSL